MTQREFAAGIVGCGRIGCGFDDDPRRGYVSTHAGAYLRTPGVRLVALADVDPDKLHRYGMKFGVAGRYADHEEMLARERLDILSVCTWNDTHYPIVRSAVEAGVKAIFCEKPIADSLSAADEMVALCAERGVILLVDHMRRFDPFHQEIAAYLRRGALGRIQQVTCYYTAGLANTGTHVFDLLRFYFGEVLWVQGMLSPNRSPNPLDPNVDGWLWFEGGFPTVVQACDVSDYLILEVHILGSEGRLRVVSSGFDLLFEAAGESPRFSGYRELRPAAAPVDANRSHEFMLQGVRHLLDCLQTGGAPLCAGVDGRRALEIVCALRESAEEQGKRIALPLPHSRVTVQSR